MTVIVERALGHVNATAFSPFTPHGTAAIGLAAVQLFWAFVVWEAITPLATESRSPKDIPRASLLAVAGRCASSRAGTDMLRSWRPFVIVLGGPLGEGDFRFLLIFKAESAEAITTCLAADGHRCACFVSPRLSGGRFCSAPRPSVSPDVCDTLCVTVQNLILRTTNRAAEG
jgi:hypothetical protein